MIRPAATPAAAPAKVVRCAIYTRKSHEEGLQQEFNSLDAQRESCEAYVASQRHDGWVVLPTRYDDGGFSGGNIDRPALKRLLDDADAGRIDAVLCYKLDRLSRSLADFVRLMELFEKRGVSFVSVTQHFDTKSSMGRLTLNVNVLLSFAQFERELTAERIRDKLAAAKMKGKYVGGRPLLGYDVNREKMRLVVNPQEADLVRHIFQRFIQLGSCMLVARDLNRQGHRTKAWTSRGGNKRGGAPWNKAYVHWTLSNRRYLGEVVHQGQAYPGEHEAIIDRRTWDRAHAILGENRRYRATQTRKKTAAILKGILQCGACGVPMAPAYTTRRGKRYQYYVCHAASKNGHDTCPVKSVPAGQIEGAVFEYLRSLFADPETVARTFRATQARAEEERRGLEKGRDALQRRLADLRKAIGRLVRAADSKAEGALSAELRRLNEEHAEAEHLLHSAEDALSRQREDLPTEQDVAAALKTIDPLWAELFPAEKERIVRLLVESVTVRPDGLSVRLRPGGLTALAAEVQDAETEPVEATA
jgi:site-specific DNA recombinase